MTSGDRRHRFHQQKKRGFVVVVVLAAAVTKIRQLTTIDHRSTRLDVVAVVSRRGGGRSTHARCRFVSSLLPPATTCRAYVDKSSSSAYSNNELLCLPDRGQREIGQGVISARDGGVRSMGSQSVSIVETHHCTSKHDSRSCCLLLIATEIRSRHTALGCSLAAAWRPRNHFLRHTSTGGRQRGVSPCGRCQRAS